MNKRNIILLFTILITYILLPILIYCFDFLFNFKFYLLTVIGILTFCLLKVFKVSNDYIGLTKNNLIRLFKRNLPSVIICVISIVIFKVLPYERFVPNKTMMFYLFYIYVSCPIQEFLYRGVLRHF